MLEIPLTIGQIGIVYDILGAAVLGWALSMAPFSVISELATGGYLVYNRQFMLSLCEQKSDAIIGLLMLIVGFILQIVGGFYGGRNTSRVFLLFAAVLIVILYSILLRPIIAKAFFRFAEAAYWKKNPPEASP